MPEVWNHYTGLKSRFVWAMFPLESCRRSQSVPLAASVTLGLWPRDSSPCLPLHCVFQISLCLSVIRMVVIGPRAHQIIQGNLPMLTFLITPTKTVFSYMVTFTSSRDQEPSLGGHYSVCYTLLTSSVDFDLMNISKCTKSSLLSRYCLYSSYIQEGFYIERGLCLQLEHKDVQKVSLEPRKRTRVLNTESDSNTFSNPCLCSSLLYFRLYSF